MSSFFESAVRFFYPNRCGVCGMLDDSGLCAVCRSAFKSVTRRSPLPVENYRILFHYAGRAGQAVKRLKYSRATCLADPMATLLEEAFEETFDDVDWIVPIPIHWTRRMERGFNQSELLCRHMPEEIVRKDVLKRVRATAPQASLSQEARQESLTGAFKVSAEIVGTRVLLIDDVVTTGATIKECVKVLKEAGVSSVSLLTFAGAP